MKNRRVAVIAAAETVNPKIPETTDAVQLGELEQGRSVWPLPGGGGRCRSTLPPMRSPAGSKRYQSPVAGEADILLAPCMTAGNLISKTMIFFGGARMAGLYYGCESAHCAQLPGGLRPEEEI